MKEEYYKNTVYGDLQWMKIGKFQDAKKYAIFLKFCTACWTSWTNE